MSAPSPIPWWFTRHGEQEARAVAAALLEGHLSHGEKTRQFEEAFARRAGRRHAIATTSGSTALLLALMALEIGPGDEVIVPARTWIATAHAATVLGARAVLADVEESTSRLDVDRVEACITSRTRALIPVHLNGRGVELDRLLELARRHDLHVVEDACQAFRSRSGTDLLGTRGDLACFSLGMTKLVSTGQGGVITTDRDSLHERLVSIRCHGIAGSVHEPTFRRSGGNFRFTDLQASPGLVQLEHLEEREARLHRLYRGYRDVIRGLPHLEGVLELHEVNSEAGELPLYVEVLTPHREALVEHLTQRGLETRPFLPCLSTAPHLDTRAPCPVSGRLSGLGLTLPSGPDQPPELLERMQEALGAFHPRAR